MPTAASAGATGIGPGATRSASTASGVMAEQQREAVLRLAQRVLQRRNLRLGLAEQGGRLAHVELARLAVLELDRGDAQALLLRLDVPRRHAQALFRGADVDVARGHVGDDRDERVVVGGHRAEIGRPVRLDPAADLSPDVDLPARAEEQVVRGVVDRDRVVHLVPAHGARQPLLLGKEVADGLVQRRAGREHAHAGDLQREVAAGTPFRRGRRGPGPGRASTSRRPRRSGSSTTRPGSASTAARRRSWASSSSDRPCRRSPARAVKRAPVVSRSSLRSHEGLGAGILSRGRCRDLIPGPGHLRPGETIRRSL